MDKVKIIPIEYLSWKDPWKFMDALLEESRNIIIVIDHIWDNIILEKKNILKKENYNFIYIDMRNNNNIKNEINTIIENYEGKICIFCNTKFIDKIYNVPPPIQISRL